MDGTMTSQPVQIRPLRMRVVGGGLAAAMSGALAVVGLLGGGLSGRPLLDGGMAAWLFFLGSYGFPISMLIGWWLGPRAGRASLRAAPVLAARAASAALILGAVEVSTASALHDTFAGVQPVTSLPSLLVFLPMIGLMVLGLPAFALLMPVTLAWTVLMRTVGPRIAPAAA